MYIHRDKYLQELIERRGNGLIKVICGLRRSGKSYLLFKIFYEWLLKEGVPPDHIICLSLDADVNRELRDADALGAHLRSRLTNHREQYYVFLDEIQFAISREELRQHDRPVRLYGILNELLHLGNVEVYVTGSNSKMLSKDVLTEFRGRGDQLEMLPLSFREFYQYVGGDRAVAYETYARFGGMPLVLGQKNEQAKAKYLSALFAEVIFKDLIERYEFNHPHILAELTDVLCSAVGSLTNVSKIVRTLVSVKQQSVSDDTIAAYLNALTEAFLFRCSKRYDIKGKKYFEYPSKYYCADPELRNARLNFRQQEDSHILENMIYNELIYRGFQVDVGVVHLTEKDKIGKWHQKATEIDFVINRGMKRYYIQSALHIDGEDKSAQEKRPLLAVRDMFRKVIITKTMTPPWIDDNGILRLGIYDFLLNEDCLDF